MRYYYCRLGRVFLLCVCSMCLTIDSTMAQRHLRYDGRIPCVYLRVSVLCNLWPNEGILLNFRINSLWTRKSLVIELGSWHCFGRAHKALRLWRNAHNLCENWCTFIKWNRRFFQFHRVQEHTHLTIRSIKMQSEPNEFGGKWSSRRLWRVLLFFVLLRAKNIVINKHKEKKRQEKTKLKLSSLKWLHTHIEHRKGRKIAFTRVSNHINC